MGSKTRTTRKQRLLQSALLSASLAAFAYGTPAPTTHDSSAWLWRLFDAGCAVGAVAALVWFVAVYRSPDDGLRFWEPNPSLNPATRHRRLWGYGSLGLAGVLAIAGAAAGYGLVGAAWWTIMLLCFAWPALLAGAVGLTLTLREPRPTPSRLHSASSPDSAVG